MEHDPLHLRDLDPADLAPAIDDVRLISGKIVECECADGASAMDLHKVPWPAPEGGGIQRRDWDSQEVVGVIAGIGSLCLDQLDWPACHLTSLTFSV